MSSERTSYIVTRSKLPEMFPTHMHNNDFWAALGRTVGSFSFLEEVLGKAIFSFQATKPYNDSEGEEAFEKWLPKLKKCLSDPLGGLIIEYEKAVRDHPESTVENIDVLISDLKEMALYRNALCHGSWRNPPNNKGETIPFFFDRKMVKFDTPINIEVLNNIQHNIVSLICNVMNSVTHMGWQFPGSSGPGEIIIDRDKH